MLPSSIQNQILITKERNKSYPENKSNVIQMKELRHLKKYVYLFNFFKDSKDPLTL